jgi:outer membrane protein assembly factor BamB
MKLKGVWCIVFAMGLLSQSHAAMWQMKQKDMYNTGRADYSVPSDRQGESFFDSIIWQKAATGAFRGSGFIFYDGAGPDGADVTVCTNAWVNAASGLDRHTGKLFWQTSPGGGDNIGKMIPAFSNDGSTVYITTDAAPGPCIAWSTVEGPGGGIWDNRADTTPAHLSLFSPTVAPDDRIFLHQWSNTCYAGIDNGTAINEVWAASITGIQICYGDPALYDGQDGLVVVTCGRAGRVAAFDGDSGAVLWDVWTYQASDGSPTIDPNNGNVYCNAGFGGDIYVVGLDIQGNNLWSDAKVQLHEDNGEPNQAERAQSTGCLSHDGHTYYFQTVGKAANGKLYAANTSDGSLKWSYPTESLAPAEMSASCPIVTRNGILVVGNNHSGQYLALRDDGDHATLLDTLEMQPNVFDGNKRAMASPVIAPDGKMYIPGRMHWTVGNGDGDTPTNNVEYCLAAFDLSGCDGPVPMDFNNDCRVDFKDMAEFAGSWLDCGLQPPERCFE